MVGRYLRYFTFLSHEEICALDRETAEHPERRLAARALAGQVCQLVHGRPEAEAAQRASQALFAGHVADLDEAALAQLVDEVPTTVEPRARLAEGLRLVDVLAAAGVTGSKGEARRVLAQGGVAVNDRRESDVDRVLGPDDLLYGRFVVLRRGKRRYHVVVVE